jgi:glutaredoxin
MRVVLYSTADPCPLCVEAWILLDDLAERLGFAFEEVHVESDPELFRRHRLRVPVLERDGLEVAHGRLDARAVEAALAGGMVEGGA